MQEKSYYDDMEKYCRELLNTVWPMFGESPPCTDKKKLNVSKEEVCGCWWCSCAFYGAAMLFLAVFWSISNVLFVLAMLTASLLRKHGS